MSDKLHVWDQVQALRDKRKEIAKEWDDQELPEMVITTLDSLDQQIASLIPQLSKADQKILKLWEKQKAVKESDPELSDLLKMQRYIIKTGKHIDHLKRRDERKDSHFHRLESRIEHLREMIAEYDQKYRKSGE